MPQDDARYRLTEAGLDELVWQGDRPVPHDAKDGELGGAANERTLARVWIGEAIVGTADSTSGNKGFDQFMKLIAAGILQASQEDAEFTAHVPVDESGVTQQFRFSHLEADLLKGERTDGQSAGPDVILYRPSTGVDQPHVLLCDSQGEQNPVHVCMRMFEMAGHRAGILVAGTRLDRSFRITEEIGADLESFVVHAAP